ncbi:MAG TPA: 3-hydroxyacyl-CoA dehydrogenase NAD-binding domain-containing protein [Candidatus Baltobacteraceae bacterium]|nr:3-hydroxyacyl-CoA dehydrogenase NAD-binding domain-containing protein [Candidatus Baltobacteraceae bacterium]
METIVVAGAGTMGAGIALLAAHNGFDVVLVEPDASAQTRALARLQKDAERLNDSPCVSRIRFVSAPEPVPGEAIAIEAVPERPDLKEAVLKSLCSALGPQALVATNTSSLSVSELSHAVPEPERFLGLHFFNPPALMKLVEIVSGEETNDESIARARSFVQRLQRTPVLAEDTPGFIVNRVARPFYLQAMRAHEAGAAPAEDLDTLARGAGFRMGPFELMDLIGLDVNLATSDSVYERTGAARLEPVQIQRDLVAQNKLGRKTGSGFYDYSNGAPTHDDAAPEVPGTLNEDEHVVIIGYDGIALELHERLSKAYANVELWQDEETLDRIPLEATIVIDIGDGATDRGWVLKALDSLLGPETMLFADAYATDIEAATKRLQHPERVAGYGILASLEHQNAVEIVDYEATSDDTLELAQELFESIGRRVVLLEPVPGLFLGRVIGSIINEAVTAVEEGVATADDVDLAMRLGTNYPQGPIEWGREIGGARLNRILKRLASAEGAAFGPHRALYILDAEPQPEADAGVEQVTGE